MNVLVTGGAGFIGSHVTERLLARGDRITCVDSFNDYYSPEAKQGNIKPFAKNSSYKLYREDILNFNALDRIFSQAKPEVVIHLAARVGVRPSLQEPALYCDVNVRGTANMLELCRKHKPKNIVFASSSSVYGANRKVPFSEEDKTDKPLSPYGATKKAGELLCHSYHGTYSMSITCLRFFTVYGERGRPDMAPYKFTKLISEGKEIEMYGDGRTKRDYTHISDITAGIINAADRELGFEIINLGNSQPVELRKLIEVIEKNLGKKASIRQMPMQQGDLLVTYADISKAKRLLAYSPKVGIEEGMRRFIQWYKSQQLQ